MIIRKFNNDDLKQIVDIWNEIVLEGNAFPQENLLDLTSGYEFFNSQSLTSVALLDGEI